MIRSKPLPEDFGLKGNELELARQYGEALNRHWESEFLLFKEKLQHPMTNPTDLAPCPFCQSNDVGIFGPPGEEYGHCRDCLADGPLADTEQEAAQLWNRRVEVNELGELRERLAGCKARGIPLIMMPEELYALDWLLEQAIKLEKYESWFAKQDLSLDFLDDERTAED